jgi:hypothetical protein
MGWQMPHYSAQASLDTLLVGRKPGMMHIVCYLRQGDQVFETYWTTRRGLDAMDYSYGLLDLTAYGRQETWEDSPPAGRNGGKARTTSAPTDVHRAMVPPEGRAIRRPRHRVRAACATGRLLRMRCTTTVPGVTQDRIWVVSAVQIDRAIAKRCSSSQLP